MFLKEYKKLAKSFKLIDDFAKEQIAKGIPDGLFCTAVKEVLPTFNQADCEKIISGKNNSFIVMGRDRDSTLISGAAGKGMLKCGMIDITAGRMSSYVNKSDTILDDDSAVNPNFASDACRIYVSQRALSVDKYFGLPHSDFGPHCEQKSTVAIKSDQTRIISREKLVLYCGKGNFEGFSKIDGELNSLGNPIVLPPRIEFLTGSPEKLQPLVLGNNLKKYLVQSNENFTTLSNIVKSISQQLVLINGAVSILAAGAPPFSKFMADSFINTLECNIVALNKTVKQANALDGLLVKGEGSILSDTVFTS